jgi:hypothetical protein
MPTQSEELVVSAVFQNFVFHSRLALRQESLTRDQPLLGSLFIGFLGTWP